MTLEKHIILTGYPRSGTTLLYNMLRGAVDNFILLDREMSAIACLDLDGNVISKRPLDIFYTKEILQANKKNKEISMILMIRDIRGIITSFHKSVRNDYFIGYDYQYFVPKEGDPVYTNPGILAMHNKIVEIRNNAMFRTLVVKYEDILSDTDGVQEKLKQEFGFTYRDSFENFHKKEIPENLSLALNRIRPVDKSKIESWKDKKHEQRIRSQFTRCPAMFDILIQYGYEKDRSWFNRYDRRINSNSGH